MAANPKTISTSSPARAIASILCGSEHGEVENTARRLIAAGLDRIPMPGSGQTLDRWRCLAAVAAFDLALVKIYESHADALAIMSELGAVGGEDGRLLAVWAAEAPGAALLATGTLDSGAQVTLIGSKQWCSGASMVDGALVTVRDADGRKWLAEVSLRQPGIAIDESGWRAVGMRDSKTATVAFDGAKATLVGESSAYLERPGFWHGGAGVAACWFGAAAAVGAKVHILQRGRDDAHAKARLGLIDGHLEAARALLAALAAAIDADPSRVIRHEALRARSVAAWTAERVLEDAAFAFGPGPLASDEGIARLFADLPVFIRQVRGGHDLAAQAEQIPAGVESPWSL